MYLRKGPKRAGAGPVAMMTHPSTSLSGQILPSVRRGLCRSLRQSVHAGASAASGLMRQIPGTTGMGPRPIVHLVGGPAVNKMRHLDLALDGAAGEAGLAMQGETGGGGATLCCMRLNPLLFDEVHFTKKNGEEGAFLARVRKARENHVAVALVIEDLAHIPVAIQHHLVTLFHSGVLLAGASTGTPFIPIGGLLPDLAERIMTIFVTPELARAATGSTRTWQATPRQAWPEENRGRRVAQEGSGGI